MGTDTATNQEEEQITTNISTSFEKDRVISMLHKSGCLDSHFKVKLYIPTSTYYKHLKKDAHQSHLGRQKMDWFLAD